MQIREPIAEATHSMIWMHGLGADYHDMASLVSQMSIDDLPIRHVFLQAPTRPITMNNGYPMPGWYDIMGMRLLDREDKNGILESESIIKQAIQKECEKGIQKDKIILSGFSQGGAMALFTGLRNTPRLGGIVALSAYLPLSDQFHEAKDQQFASMPIFMGYGEQDPLVLPEWSQLTVKKINALGLTQVTARPYPMEHSICLEEMLDLKRWLQDGIVK